MSIGAGLTATSNTTACTITGLPASLQPPASGSIYSPTVVVENNTIFELGTFDIRSANGGSLILQRAGGVSFTNVGIKGIAPCTFMYSLT